MPVVPGSAPPDFGRVGFIGLGDMGEPMAHNLLSAGFDVTVFNRKRAPLFVAAEKGASIAENVASLTQDCSTIGICVWNDEQLTDAVLGPKGLITGDAEKLTLIVHSTVRPQSIDHIVEAFAPKGWEVVDAPVSGLRPASLAGTLTLMVGAPQDTFERLLPYFNTVGQHVLHVGEKPGLGEVSKICNNLMAQCNLYAVIEAMKLGSSYGMDEEMVRQVAGVSTGRSWFSENLHVADHLILNHPQRDVLYKDLWEAVFASKHQDLQLMVAGVAALSAPALIEERRAQLEARNKSE